MGTERAGQASSGSGPVADLIDTLDLELIDRDIFRGKSPPTRLQRIFGGQVAAQALVAAQRSVEVEPGRPLREVHSLHAYFLRPGDTSRPVVYEVDRIRDGRSYATRRVVGLQGGKAIFNLQASFHPHEEGYEHQIAMPDGLAEPSSLPRWRFRADDEGAGGDEDPLPSPEMPFELRVAPPAGGYQRLLWLRTVSPLPEDATLQCCVAAYASDLTLLSVAFEVQPPPLRPPAFVASLDHAMWFHRPLRVDRWTLYAQSAISTGDGRGLTQGQMFSSDGHLAVTVVQEAALRPGA